MSTTILTLELRHEQDVVLARQRARQVAALLGFDPREQTALATAASEVTRDVLQLGGPAGGRAEFGVEAGPPPALRIRIGGRGVPAGELQAIAAGRNPAPNGLGLGLLGARRLVDHLAVGPDAEGGAGAAVTLTRALPRRAAPRPRGRGRGRRTWRGSPRSWPARPPAGRWRRSASRTASCSASWTSSATARRPSAS